MNTAVKHKPVNATATSLECVCGWKSPSGADDPWDLYDEHTME